MGAADGYKRTFRYRANYRMDDLGLSKASVARAVGVGTTTIHYWLIGRTLPNLALAGLLADTLGVSLDWLLDRDERGYRGASA